MLTFAAIAAAAFGLTVIFGVSRILEANASQRYPRTSLLRREVKGRESYEAASTDHSSGTSPAASHA